ncbi:hypothetical protein LSCM1_00745 [Leishmania martiniquensis]|uniref:Elks delta-like protein n=1 Tax=Leishmania martiniquensis TaxID=1580590 RepID=A0A836K673_9TRYP|nr:hypothetical protein LSCM1_00745 [Leishmania martiniquensis]
MATKQQEPMGELRRKLQLLEGSLAEGESELADKRLESLMLNSELTSVQFETASQEESRAIASDAYRSASRVKQVLENGQAKSDQFLRSNREEYVNQLMAADDATKSVEVDIGEISSRIKGLKEKKVEAQKRLTVVRLMSMMDDLQNLLKKKVNGPSGGEETRAQELLKTLQELSRERERTIHLVAKKEREMAALIDLKKRRIKELRKEFTRNVKTYADSNSRELSNVAQRIQEEREHLLREIERLEEGNQKMKDALADTRFTAETAVRDRGTALSAVTTMSVSANPERECMLLRERIQKANEERRMYMRKTEEVQADIDEEMLEYNEHMSRLRREISFYQDESTRFEKENNELKRLCDTLAMALGN